jgi:hypothetical protein
MQEVVRRHALHQQRRHLAAIRILGQMQEIVGRIIA